MMSDTTRPDSWQPAAEMAVDLFDNWFDPIESEVRARAREFIEEMIRGELDTMLARPRYGRSQIAGDEESAVVTGHRHGSRTRSLTGTFGPIEIAPCRAKYLLAVATPAGRAFTSISRNGTIPWISGIDPPGADLQVSPASRRNSVLFSKHLLD